MYLWKMCSCQGPPMLGAIYNLSPRNFLSQLPRFTKSNPVDQKLNFKQSCIFIFISLIYPHNTGILVYSGSLKLVLSVFFIQRLFLVSWPTKLLVLRIFSKCIDTWVAVIRTLEESPNPLKDWNGSTCNLSPWKTERWRELF